MKRIASVFFLFSMLAFTVFQGMRPRVTVVLKEENMEKAFENVLCSAVRIQGSGHYGSGSILLIKGEEIIIATNKHVVQYFDDNSYITFFNGESCSGSVLGSSETADVGFISVSASELLKETESRLKAVSTQTKAYEELKENSCFFMIDLASNPAGPVIYKGAVVDKEKYLPDYGMEMLYGDGMAVPGMSGSGIFDYYGNFIGILSGATEQYELAGIPLETVLEEYEKCVDRL